ncbi:MAG: pilus assembly protein PilP [Desulfobacterales bacterium]|nr:pilus assembly protein PilP [Desulfobacterales bacterium]
MIRKKIVMNKETAAAPENKKTTDTELTSVPPATDSPVAAYDPKGKIDPFIPFFEYQQQGSQSGNKKRSHSLTPLERLDLNQLKLVGIIRSAAGNKAVVEEASGKGYIVSKDTLIGINSGKVLEILTDRVIVQEEVENLIGVVKIMNKELILQRPPGEF